MKVNWIVLEDNGGTLHLGVQHRHRNIFYHAYDRPGQLREDIDALEKGSDPRTWDGNEGRNAWLEIFHHEYGNMARKEIATGEYSRGKGYTICDYEAMGAAGQCAFGKPSADEHMSIKAQMERVETHIAAKQNTTKAIKQESRNQSEYQSMRMK